MRATYLPDDVPELTKPETVEQYRELWRYLSSLEQTRPDDYLEALSMWFLQDLYFGLRYVLATKHWVRRDGTHGVERQFVIDQARQVEAGTNLVVDLWAREHFKSSLKSYANHIRRLMCDPNLTICIMSYKYGAAAKFLRKIKFELETNHLLMRMFPGKLWLDPKREAPKWGERDGLVLPRDTNPTEASVEAHGLLDGMPVGSHFAIVSYDDVVTRENVTNADQIEKLNESFDLSLALGREDGSCFEGTGTNYSLDDTYQYMIEQHGWEARRVPCCPISNEFPLGDIDNGVLYGPEYLASKRQADSFVWACQWLVSPAAGQQNAFKLDNLRFYSRPADEMAKGTNKYILVDPAGEKKKGSDFTVMWVVGLGADQNYYVLDGVYDRLDVWGRVGRLFDLVFRWRPFEVRYEKYSMQADVQVINREMEERKHYFNIVEVGGNVAKRDRIASNLGPIVSKRRLILPTSMVRINARGEAVDLVAMFLDQFNRFPSSRYDDALDAMARIEQPDMPLCWPVAGERVVGDSYDRAEQEQIDREISGGVSWMGVP